ncbi:transcriptional regulator family: Fungal Specific TF [Paecilomyces variotii]|nr:transcriptional regulator family: Fungal Specific TF [Paecilomyces variotii]
MAGPGGGPPRKSHTKSRNGCKTCKKRHIRCDETFPQCRNCTKHNCRCDYMDNTVVTEGASRSQRAPDLLMSPEIEMEIENWRRTGICPFTELSHLCPENGWHHFSHIELRLIHHIAGLSVDLHRQGYSGVTVWAQRMPHFLAIGVSNDFVMSSILALSASHLAWITKDRETDNLAYHHRGVAIKGLQGAIGAFSRENCDAILSASILLSWQITEWRGWVFLQRGVSTVLSAMQPLWKEESELAQFVERQRSFRSTRTPGYQNNINQFHDDELDRFDRTYAVLANIQQRIGHNQEHYQRIADLLGFVQQLRHDLPLQSPEEAFERLQPLRTWLFWLPPAMLRGEESDLGALAVLAQFYAVALALEPLFPAIGGTYLGCMSAGPIEDIYRIVLARKAAQPFSPEVQLALALMDLPFDIVTTYRNNLHNLARPTDHYSPTPPSPYHGLQDFHSAPLPSNANLYSAYASPVHTPPATAMSVSPFHLTSVYGSRAQAHDFTDLHSQPTHDRAGFSSYERLDAVDDHSSTYSPTYVNDIVGHGAVTSEDFGGSSMGAYHGPSAYNVAAHEVCWT